MKYSIFIIFICVIMPLSTQAASLGSRLAGKVLLDVERSGEAWYVSPTDNNRYPLKTADDVLLLIRKFGVGIKEVDFQKIAQAEMPVAGDVALAKKFAGKILIQVESKGEAWYISPVNYKKYFLGSPKDALRIMSSQGIGIKKVDLAKIHKSGMTESMNQYSQYEHKKILVNKQNFTVDTVTIDLSNPKLKISTPVSSPYPVTSLGKSRTHGANTLTDFVFENKAFAGMNASYFCSYSNCDGPNYYFYPVYDKNKNVLINEDQLKYWTTGPIMAFDENNKFYYFKDSREFKNKKEFETKNNVKLQALIGSRPRLIENYMNLLIDWDIDDKQLKLKAQRNAMAFKDNKIILVVAKNATVPELADIMKAMGVQYALNLDGGYSSALFYNDEYMVGPGRNIPNAITFSEK